MRLLITSSLLCVDEELYAFQGDFKSVLIIFTYILIFLNDYFRAFYKEGAHFGNLYQVSQLDMALNTCASLIRKLVTY